MSEFTPEQKNYLQGLAMGVDVARHVQGLPVISNSAACGDQQATSIQIGGKASAPTGPDALQIEAQNRFLAAGKKLAKEEEAKRAKSPFEMWERRAGQVP
jgi:ferredoxin-nitrite reductase